LSCHKRILTTDLKRKGSGEDDLGVGLTHSRGVIGVMPYESKAHSKGSAIKRRDEEKHVPDNELEQTCKRN
jgi:hypothetical protein